MQIGGAKRGFTIVEVIVVVVVIAILATLSIFGVSSWRARTATTELKNALISAATAMKAEKNISNGYPSAIPSSYSNSSTVVLELASSSPTDYCINAYSKVISEEQFSISSDATTPRAGLCNATSATAPVIGGSIPDAPLGKDLSPPLSEWTLAGGATYSASSGITLGTTGRAYSPKIRIKGTLTKIEMGGTFFATTQSPYAAHQPNGGWQGAINYYDADATTAVVNSGNGYSSNGITQQIALNTWGSGITSNPYRWSMGSNVYYVKLTLYGADTGYASPDLKVKSIYLKPL